MINIKDYANSLTPVNMALSSSFTSGCFKNTPIRSAHRPNTAELAVALLAVENFGHHVAAITIGRMLAAIGNPEIDKAQTNYSAEELKRTRGFIRSNISTYAQYAFRAIYPGHIGAWRDRPWLCDGLRSEVALAECAALIMRIIPKYVYADMNNPLSGILKPILDVVSKSVIELGVMPKVPLWNEPTEINVNVDWMVRLTDEVSTEYSNRDTANETHLTPSAPDYCSDEVRLLLVHAGINMRDVMDAKIAISVSPGMVVTSKGKPYIALAEAEVREIDDTNFRSLTK